MARCRRCPERAPALAALLLCCWAASAEAQERPALALRGFVQADAVAYRQDAEDELDGATLRPLNEVRFLIRRAHLRAEASWRFLGAAVEVMGTTLRDPPVRLFAAEASFGWPEPRPGSGRRPSVGLSLGLLRVPFGLDLRANAQERFFLERAALARALFPGDNDLGLVVHGAVWLLRLQLGVMNGHPLGERAFPALDPSAAKDLLGRLGIDAPLPRGVTLAAGVSGLWGTGFHAGTPSTKDSVSFRDLNGDGVVQLSELSPVFGTAATPSQTFGRSALGVDLHLSAPIPRLGRLAIFGEIVWATNLDRGLFLADPVAVGRDLRELGVYVALTQELTRHAQIGARFDRYDPDADADEQLGPARVPVDVSFTTVSVAAAARLPPWGRLVVEYDHQRNALGRTQGGLPTTLNSDALTLRGEVVF